MVPTFALSLSFDGIALLRRGPDGWAQLDQVAADAPDLDVGMARLRRRAATAGPEGDAVLLLLPDAQIRYLGMPCPASDPAGAARAAMQGATPYAVADLTIDHVATDGTLYVAAVANETLAEAEAFARTHAFRPTGFAALPPDGVFPGAALFGAAASWTGPAPTRPAVPAVVLTRGTSGPDADAPAKDAALSASAGLDTAAPAEQTAATTPDAVDDKPPPPTFASRRAAGAKATGAVIAAAPPAAARTQPSGETRAAPARPESKKPDPGAAARSGGKADQPAFENAPGPYGSKPQTASATPSAVTAKTPGEAFRERILDRARAAETAASDTPSPPARRRGRRDPRPEQTVLAANGMLGGTGALKGRKVRLFLAAALLAALALVAVWSLREAPFSGATPDPIATLPAPQDIDPQDPARLEADEDVASAPVEPRLETQGLPGSGDETALVVPDPEPADSDGSDVLRDAESADDSAAPELATRPLTTDEAAATYAATGIWKRAPEAPVLPETGAVEDLYVASIDPSVQQFDAVALPPARSYDPDAAPAEPGPPPPPGVIFTLDERGLVPATPEGALTPEGHRVFSGRPPVVPPLRDTALPAPQVEDLQPSPFAGLRPSARPGDLVEQNERATLQGLSRDELADFRPARRPNTEQEQAEIDAPEATDEAVAQSLLPEPRPGGFGNIVTAARQSRPEPAETPAPPPNVNPDIPTTAEVARAATVRNAINLSDTALFGIYGGASDRRALVRLPNGDYEKVKVGDRLDGGEVLAIGETELRYRKQGRTVTLELPRG